MGFDVLLLEPDHAAFCAGSRRRRLREEPRGERPHDRDQGPHAEACRRDEDDVGERLGDQPPEGGWRAVGRAQDQAGNRDARSKRAEREKRKGGSDMKHLGHQRLELICVSDRPPGFGLTPSRFR
jgi:hypothetical protein